MHQMVEKAVQNQRSSEKSENLTVFSMRKPVWITGKLGKLLLQTGGIRLKKAVKYHAFKNE